MKTLIAYATKYGSAEKCAKILVARLIGEVDLCNLAAEQTKELSQYDKIIIGGSIYAGRIQKSVTSFCLNNLPALQKMPLGLYVCGMLADQAEEELTNAFVPELLAKAAVKEFFGGEIKFGKINFMEKFMVKMVSKMDKNIPALDTSRDISMISEKRIDQFALAMNKFS